MFDCKHLPIPVNQREPRVATTFLIYQQRQHQGVPETTPGLKIDFLPTLDVLAQFKFAEVHPCVMVDVDVCVILNCVGVCCASGGCLLTQSVPSIGIDVILLGSGLRLDLQSTVKVL